MIHNRLQRVGDWELATIYWFMIASVQFDYRLWKRTKAVLGDVLVLLERFLESRVLDQRARAHPRYRIVAERYLPPHCLAAVLLTADRDR